MKKRIAVITFALLLVLLTIQGCTTKDVTAPTAQPAATAEPTATIEPTAATEPTATAAPTATNAELVLTLDELAKYDGKNGNPAYIAVDGVIYDVTDVPQWKGGEHHGFTAGNDLTVQIKTISPHGVAKLIGVPIVGKLAN